MAENCGWRWYITMWDNILNDTTRCNLDDDFMLKVKLKDMREVVDALKTAEAEVKQLRTLLHDSQSRRGHCECEGTCDCTSFWRHVRQVLGEE
jgi:hypothetical protein